MTASLDHETVDSLLTRANRAPSFHNTQPWRWSTASGSVSLHADLHRWLPVSDAVGRDLVVSCGAALHHLRVAAGAAGVRTAVDRLPDPDNPDHLATVTLTHGPDHTDRGLAAAIAHRHSDRRPFVAWPVPRPTLDGLDAAAAAQGAALRVVPEGRAHERVLRGAAEAATAQEAIPGYREELAGWSGRRGTADGVPAANAPSPGDTEVAAGRRFAAGDLEPTELGPDGSTLLVVGTSSDDTLARLRAGEALSAVLLGATEAGLSTCVLTQPLEHEPTWRSIRDHVLGGSLCPQVLVRIGWVRAAEHLPETPRLPASHAGGDGDSVGPRD